MGNSPQDEIPHPQGVRPQEDYLLDRREVEAQQCVQLTRTNGRGLLLWCGELDLLSVYRLFDQLVNQSLGDSCDGSLPGPFSNPVVKAVSADGTWGAAPWESRSSPRDFFFLISPPFS